MCIFAGLVAVVGIGVVIGVTVGGGDNDSGLYEAPDDVETMITETGRSSVGTLLAQPLSTGSQTVIVTNHHVIEPCLDPLVPVMINFAGGSISTDDLISDEVNDLAVIRTSHSFEGLQPRKNLGHWVMAVGTRLRSLGEFRDSQ